MSELRRIVQKLSQARSEARPPARLLWRISPASCTPSPTLLDFGFVILNVPGTLLAHAVGTTLEIGREGIAAVYPDTGESGETYDVELGVDRMLTKDAFELDRVVKTVR